MREQMVQQSVQFILKGSQEDNKKKDKRNKKGEHHERIDSIVVECIF